MRKLLAVSALLVLTAACGSSGPGCKSSTECGVGSVCLASAACAPVCSNDKGCLADEKCSTSGGCVPKTGCGADSECGKSQVCEGVSCVASCATAGCGSGRTCQADGHCSQPTQNGAGGGGGSGAGGGMGMTCGGELFQATRVQANFLIVLDQSGSMGETLPAGGTKWNLATAALKSVTSTNQTAIRFGLSMFPGATKCSEGSNFVPVGDSTAAAIASAFPVKSNGSGTPIGAALQLAAMRPELTDVTRANYVLLVTDGMENCQGDPVAAVKALAAKGVKTYVVGFGADVDATRLAQMAVEGGTARLTTPKYYQADDQGTLNTAFTQIAAGAVGCDYKLQKEPPDLNKVYVAIDGNLINRDRTKQMGWEYDPSTMRLTLYGGACDVVRKATSPKVQIVYGCPDPTIIENAGHGDGGYPAYDGGVTIN
jgi:hypothetical protein